MKAQILELHRCSADLNNLSRQPTPSVLAILRVKARLDTIIQQLNNIQQIREAENTVKVNERPASV